MLNIDTKIPLKIGHINAKQRTELNPLTEYQPYYLSRMFGSMHGVQSSQVSEFVELLVQYLDTI